MAFEVTEEPPPTIHDHLHTVHTVVSERITHASHYFCVDNIHAAHIAAVWLCIGIFLLLKYRAHTLQLRAFERSQKRQ